MEFPQPLSDRAEAAAAPEEPKRRGKRVYDKPDSLRERGDLPESGVGRVLAYIRRSEEDRTGKPIATQAETILSYVREVLSRKETDCETVRKFYIDNGVPGTVPAMDRPALRELLADLNRVENAHLVVFDVSRIARAADVGIEIKSIVERRGGKIHFAQSRQSVEGPSLDLLFGIGLHIASAERTNTMQRIRAAFVNNHTWDKRKSFGWRVNEKGESVEHPEEQVVLERIRKLFEEDGLRTAEISRIIQEETGGRRWRKEGKSEDELTPWDSSEIAFIAKKNRWKWGGVKEVDGKSIGRTREDLKRETAAAIAAGKTMDSFLEENRGVIYDGVKINRAMLKNYFITARPKWYQHALRLAVSWVEAEKYSVDDGVSMLNKEVPRETKEKEPWTRQTVWRLFKHAREVLALNREARAKREARRIMDTEP